jgi:hypothetical protein
MAHRFFDGNRQSNAAANNWRRSAMEMPKVTEQHLLIQRLAGTWVGEEKMHPSPWSPGGTRTGRYDHRIICDGFFVAGDYLQMDANKTTYTGHAVFGVDPATQETTWYWVDSMGVPPASPARGRWEGDTLALIGRDSNDQIHGRYTFAFVGPERIRFSIENTRDGGKSWSTFLEAEYTRTKPPA